MFDMPDSNRNWKNRFFFVKGTDWVCRPDEWDKLPGGYFDNTWAYIRESGCPPFFLPSLFIFQGNLTVSFNTVCFPFVSAIARPEVSDEQGEFIRRILTIPLEQRRCRDLITLDTLHLYCGGPEPTVEARKLEEFSRKRK